MFPSLLGTDQYHDLRLCSLSSNPSNNDGRREQRRRVQPTGCQGKSCYQRLETGDCTGAKSLNRRPHYGACKAWCSHPPQNYARGPTRSHHCARLYHTRTNKMCQRCHLVSGFNACENIIIYSVANNKTELCETCARMVVLTPYHTCDDVQSHQTYPPTLRRNS